VLLLTLGSIHTLTKMLATRSDSSRPEGDMSPLGLMV